MRRYTNPTISATVSPVSIVADASEIQLMIKQDSSGAELVVNSADGLEVDTTTGTVSYTLTRDQSNGFIEGYALVQVKGRTNGLYWASDIAEVQVKRLLSTDTGGFISGEEVIG